MKKIFLSLVAIMSLTSVNAQVIEILDKGQTVARYTNTGAHDYTIKIGEMDCSGLEDTKLKDPDDSTEPLSVGWVQLWAGGPRFAEWNLGATKVGEVGNRYTYAEALTAVEELWGDNWTLPCDSDWEELLAEAYTYNYSSKGRVHYKLATVDGISGMEFCGVGEFASCKLFLPFAGIYKEDNKTLLISENADGFNETSTYYWGKYSGKYSDEDDDEAIVGFIENNTVHGLEKEYGMRCSKKWHVQIRPILKVNK